MRLMSGLGQVFLAVLGLTGTIADGAPAASSMSTKPTKNANSPEQIFRKADNYYSLGKFNQASNLLEKFKFSGKQESYRLFHLARALARQNRLEESIKKNLEAMAINPALFAAKFNNMCYAALLRDFNRANSFFHEMIQAIATDPHSKLLAGKYSALAQSDPDLLEFRKRSEFKSGLNELERISHPTSAPAATPNASGSPPPFMPDEGDNCPACGMG